MTQNEVSTKTLIKSTIAAAIFALLVLVCFILPAEYNIDPTHIGKTLGLTALAVNNQVEVIPAKPLTTALQTPIKIQHTIEVVVPAENGIEYKFYMDQHQKMTYEWKTSGQTLYFDLHGEPQGDTTGYFESYAIATLHTMKGSFTAPFTGSHGWYWKNDSNQPVSVNLRVEGQYSVIGLK